MPVNELEQHPFLNYIDFSKIPYNSFEKLIIGTFPVYHITDTVYPADRIQHRFNPNEAYMKFFYGSKRNKFWKWISTIFEVANPTLENNPENREYASKSILYENKILIQDVIKSTNREGYSAKDTDLWIQSDDASLNENRLLNHDMINLLNQCKKIKFLYFTSKNAYDWFSQIIGGDLVINDGFLVNNNLISMSLRIGQKNYTAFFLPSPSSNGSRRIPFTDNNRLQTFVNYLNANHPAFFNEIENVPQANRTRAQNMMLTEFRDNFIVECWRQAIVHCNPHYDGTFVNQ